MDGGVKEQNQHKNWSVEARMVRDMDRGRAGRLFLFPFLLYRKSGPLGQVVFFTEA